MTIVDAGVPILVFGAMVVVGMDLTTDDLRLVLRQARMVITATVAQVVLLPFIGWLLLRSFQLKPTISQGVILVVACPTGAMANVYTFLARGNVALSVTLTTASCLTAALTTPLALAFLQAQGGGSSGFHVPIGVLAGQLVLLLVLPVLIGMRIRRHWPDITSRHARALLCFSVATLIVLLGIIIVQEAEQFSIAFTDIAAATGVLTVLAFGAGWTTGWVSGAAADDCFAVGMAFVVRNVGIATAVAITTLGRAEFAVFATAYFLSQVPLLVSTALVFRRLSSNRRSLLGGSVQS